MGAAAGAGTRLLEAAGRIVERGGTREHEERAADLRARFEERTGAFASEDPWFEERSRAFWCDAVTRGRFGREVEGELAEGDRALLAPLERAHRGLFRWASPGDVPGRGEAGDAGVFVDIFSGARFAVTETDEASQAELEAGAGQLFDARLVGAQVDDAPVVALLPGAIFHPRAASEAIESLLPVARSRSLSLHDTLDALLRMERTLRALSRVKTSYAYRAEALLPQPSPGSPATGPRAASGATRPGPRAGRPKRA